MGTPWIAKLTAGVVCAGFILVHPGPDPLGASVPGAHALMIQAVSDTAGPPADNAAAGAEGDTIPREGLSPVVRVSAGLSILTGSVVVGDASEPLSAAIVTLHRAQGQDAEGLRTETDEHGRFRFEGIPSGDYLIRTHHIGYRDRSDTVTVGHEDLVALDIPLATEAVELPPLEVSVRSAWLARTGFYWRKERGLGQFMSPEDVDRRSARNFAELVRAVPGVQVIRICNGSFPCDKMLRMRHTNTARRCRVQYFMDGRPMSGTVYPADISAQDIAAVEVYRNIAETPAQFYGRCGSVVMWTKRFDPSSDSP